LKAAQKNEKRGPKRKKRHKSPEAISNKKTGPYFFYCEPKKKGQGGPNHIGGRGEN